MSNYISEAFQALNLLESEQFTFDKKGSLQLGNFLEDDTFDDFETVIDPEAKTEDEIKDSYIGDVILGCDVCHSMIYKNPEEVEVDEELNLANVGECCPYCYTADGFKIIGTVAPYVEIDVESNEDVEVEVDGKTIESNPTGSEEVVDEEVAPEQKYPVQSPIAESMTKVNRESIKAKFAKARGSACDEELEPEQKYPVESPIAEAKEDKKILKKRQHMKDGAKEEIEACQKYPVESPIGEEVDADQKYPIKSPVGTKGLKEGMEDISITTDDEVIKVKATPRVDKETIVPPTEEEIAEVEEPVEDVVEEPTEEVAGEATEEPAAEGEEGMVDVDVEEVDETSFDELGESYLKKVYDNVAGYKTQDAKLRGNQLIMEGVIEFTSGKKAITEFKFEAVDMYKDGKVRLVGLNENLSRNKKAFTLRGAMNGNKLMIETFNYNYSAKDIKTGKSKRLYGTVSKGN